MMCTRIFWKRDKLLHHKMSLLYPTSPPSLVTSTKRTETIRYNIIGAGVQWTLNESAHLHHGEERKDKIAALLERCISVYKYFETNQTNPMSLLVEYYQKSPQRDKLHGGSLQNPSSWFRDEQVQLLGPSGGEQPTTYWHSVFQCPLSPNVQTASCLPLPLFVHEVGNKVDAGNDKVKALASMTQEFFGKSAYKVSRGLVYWNQKKAARKSCALAALLQLGPPGDDEVFRQQQGMEQPLFVWKPGHEAIFKRDQPDGHSVNHHQNASAEVDLAGNDEYVHQKSQRKFPSWVNQLYELGLQSISISYYQSTSPEDPDEWNMEPCPIFCHIEVYQPVSLTVEGTPSLSKKEARQNAIEKLESRCHFPVSPFTPAKLIKEGIFKSDAKTINMRPHLPSWATSSFLDSQESEFVMYQLVLLTASGESWVQEKMGFGDKAQETPIGIIFPCDILSSRDKNELEFHAQFTTKGKDGAECETHAILKNRKKISLQKDLLVLLRFNQFLQKSRTFGFSKKSARPALVDLASVPGARTYLFVPLDADLNIDFMTMKSTLNGKMFPLQSINWSMWKIPILGMVDSRSVSGISLLVALAVFNFTWYSLVLSTVSLLISVVAFLLPLRTPQKFFSKNELSNRFLIHRGILYVADAGRGPSSFTARSSMPKNEGTMDDDYWLKNSCGFDVESATFENYYLKRFGLELRYPKEHLISANRVQRHTDHDPFENNEMLVLAQLFLIPELVFCLAPPRDFVYIVNQAPKFMPELERKIDIRRLAKSQQLTHQDQQDVADVDFDLLSSLLEEATTSYPYSKFERLEFLGDTILGFFLTLEAARMNKTSTWTADAMADFVALHGKNVSLVDACLNIGLQRAIYARRVKWSSAYGCIQVPESFQFDYFELQQSFLSDIFEAFLAAVFLAFDKRETTRYKVLFRVLRRAFPVIRKSSTILPPFLHQKKIVGGTWNRLLLQLRDAVCRDFVLHQKLQENKTFLLKKLFPGVELEACTNVQIDVLTWCAIFNFDETLCCDSQTENHLKLIAQVLHIQEMEFQVGNFSVRLLITLDLFKRYPDATPGDLMLQLTSAVCDDALSYLMTKNGLHRALLDCTIAEAFIAQADAADIEGRKRWSNNFGWILEGGEREFSRRMAEGGSPRYPGLLGGRLFGKTHKVPAKVTDLLVFFFKAMVGALVLGHGLDNSWNCLNPIFAEVLLLSGEEIRSTSNSIVSKTYASGTKRR